MKQSRKLKKAIKRASVAYDISSTPSGIDVDGIFTIFKEQGMLFYDSKKGVSPMILGRKNKRIKIVKTNKIKTK